MLPKQVNQLHMVQETLSLMLKASTLLNSMHQSPLFLVLKIAALHQVTKRSPHKATIHAHSHKLIYQVCLTDKATNGDPPLDLHLDIVHLSFLFLREDLHSQFLLTIRILNIIAVAPVLFSRLLHSALVYTSDKVTACLYISLLAETTQNLALTCNAAC